MTTQHLVYYKSAIKVNQLHTSRRRGHWFKGLLWLIASIVCLILLGFWSEVGYELTNGLGSEDRDSQNHVVSRTRRSLDTLSDQVHTARRTLWKPSLNTTWQIVLNNPIKLAYNASHTVPDVDVFDIDLFDNSKETIWKLHGLHKKVICYFSAGTYEDWRPDAEQFKKKDLGKSLNDWPGENWLRINSCSVRKIMRARIKLASQKGCDAIDPDNIDGYSNENGLRLTKRDSIRYIRFLAQEAARYKMSCGLKNGGDLISSVLRSTHFAINEQCVQYSECGSYTQFIRKKKPVFHIEYPKTSNKTADFVCNAVKGMKFSTILKDMSLNGWAEYCDGKVVSTPVDTS
ncbi:glycoside hydrolase family 114 protein [Myriangium duriaei CBS 260.36]|uniref:alpha-galactosidase n=1 Tax=Myriangium duriaei CBS 260.36 TaxID=1168546 RepID=A0A9P4J7S6_9PEZI|nr:glycoside hydrolase family 114 protein [Myriangium duriaei CBS 260.36]